MSASADTRGRPLAVLVILLVGWVTVRAMVWQAPDGEAYGYASSQLASLSAPETLPAPAIRPRTEATLELERNEPVDAVRIALPAPHPQREPARSIKARDLPQLAFHDGASAEVLRSPAVAGGHQILFLAAMSHLPVPAEVEDLMISAAGPDLMQPSQRLAGKRWSVDSWLLKRQGSNSQLVSLGRAPTYGASQAGAVFNYRLAPDNPRDPRSYLRAYKALIADGESELAAGLSARPFPRWPLRAHAEMRVTYRAGDTDFRPAAFVTTELAPQSLPYSSRAEFYGQAGYVFGEGATGFADGQLHVLREVWNFDLARISMGAAAWGGIQRGAERLDVGPSMRADMQFGQTPARVSLDWRERVAGDAEPHSGVALTLSTRF